MSRDTVRQFLNIVAIIATLVVNILANALPINGQTTASISNRLPILFVPANYVFSIWGLIYLLLLGYAVFQALPAQKTDPTLRRIGWWVIISCIANISWVLLFHYNQFAFSMVAMLVLLVALATIYTRIRAGRDAGSLAESVLVRGTFSIYLGWITVATIANAAYVLFDAQWDGFGIADTTWTILLLVIAALVTSVMLLRHRDLAYTGVIIWALVGIVIKQSDVAPVAITAGLMIALIVAVAVVSRLRPAHKQPALA